MQHNISITSENTRDISISISINRNKRRTTPLICLMLFSLAHEHKHMLMREWKQHTTNKWVRSSAYAYAHVAGVLTCLCLCYAYACAYAYTLVRTSLNVWISVKNLPSNNRPNRLTQCCNQFKSPGLKILCVLHSWNKTFYSQRVWIRYNIELAVCPAKITAKEIMEHFDQKLFCTILLLLLFSYWEGIRRDYMWRPIAVASIFSKHGMYNQLKQAAMPES